MKATTFGARLRKVFDVSYMVGSDRVQNEVVIYLNAPDGTQARICMDANEARTFAERVALCADDVKVNGY